MCQNCYSLLYQRKTGNGLRVAERHAWKGKKSTLGLYHSTDIAPVFAATLPLNCRQEERVGTSLQWCQPDTSPKTSDKCWNRNNRPLLAVCCQANSLMSYWSCDLINHIFSTLSSLLYNWELGMERSYFTICLGGTPVTPTSSWLSTVQSRAKKEAGVAARSDTLPDRRPWASQEKMKTDSPFPIYSSAICHTFKRQLHQYIPYTGTCFALVYSFTLWCTGSLFIAVCNSALGL